MAENDINLKGTGSEDNIWQLITKRGDLNMAFSGNAVIREINAAKNLKIVSTGENLTIYDLGKTSNLSELDDILQPHDQLGIASVAPETVDISVLDINPDNDSTPGEGNSTLNIYNAYVKGQNNGNVDVRLRADNIIAHAYDAASSPVSNTTRPNGFDATENRTYANDITDKNADKNLKARQFSSLHGTKAMDTRARWKYTRKDWFLPARTHIRLRYGFLKQTIGRIFAQYRIWIATRFHTRLPPTTENRFRG